MENKYYTPTIEEFHVGFECEVYGFNPNNRLNNNIEKKWEKITFSIEDINLLKDKYLDSFRVKYLDREDIESLGFEYQDGKMIKGYSDNFIYKPNNNLQYNLTYVYAKNILRIHVEDLVYFEESYNYLYQGKIKNKSELKRILKQLNI